MPTLTVLVLPVFAVASDPEPPIKLPVAAVAFAVDFSSVSALTLIFPFVLCKATLFPISTFVFPLISELEIETPTETPPNEPAKVVAVVSLIDFVLIAKSLFAVKDESVKT